MRYIVLFTFLFCQNAFSQSVGINTSNPDPSAALHIEDQKGGLLTPRMKDAQMNAIVNPANGLIIYNTNTNTFWYHHITSGWLELENRPKEIIVDNDNDTKIIVDSSSLDRDKISFRVKNDLALGIERNPNNIIRFHLGENNNNTFLGHLSGQHANSFRNTAIGYSAARSLTTGTRNSFLGFLAGSSNTTGNFNVYFGAQTGSSGTTASYNTSLGTEAGQRNETGISNVFIGYRAGLDNRASGNVFVGAAAGQSNHEGENNVSVGQGALSSNENGDGNIAMGWNALKRMSNGNNNIGIGNHSGRRILEFSNLIAIGDSSSLGGNEIVIGHKASTINDNHDSKNIVLGNYAAYQATAGNTSIMVGYKVADSAQLFSNSIIIGANSFENGFNSNHNLILGTKSASDLRNSNNNLIFGHNAASVNNYSDYNVILGSYAAPTLNHSDHNVILGNYSGIDSYLNDCVVIGDSSAHDVTGLRSVILGKNAGINSANAFDNCYIGYKSGMDCWGSNNIFIGTESGKTGANVSSKIAIGFQAGIGNSSKSVVIGTQAGLNTHGSNHVVIGHGAGINSSGGNNVIIGYQAGQNLQLGDKLVIANSNTNKPLIFGDFSTNTLKIHTRENSGISAGFILQNIHDDDYRFMDGNEMDVFNSDMHFNHNTDGNIVMVKGGGGVGIGMTPTTNILEVDGNASKSAAGDWLANSDIRLKKEVEYLNSQEMLLKLLEMKAIQYEWNDIQTGTTRPKGIQYGFSAQDLQKIWPDKVSEDKSGYLQTAYGTYDYLYVEAIKALYDRIVDLEKEQNDTLSEKEEMFIQVLGEQQSQIDQLQKTVNELIRK